MRIVAISDTHGQHERLQVPDGDLLIFAGDCSSRGYLQEITSFLEWFSNHPHKCKVMIAGNHDFLFEEQPCLAETLIPKGIHYLNDSGVVIEGMPILGSPVSPRFFDWAFNRDRGSQIERHWSQIPRSTEILITHGPPAGILDQTLRGEVTGCEDLLRNVQHIKPKLHIFGHIHEGYGKSEKDGTLFVNACNLDAHYRMRNVAIVLDI
jgi:Icc-related predicted phosphoesterase